MGGRQSYLGEKGEKGEPAVIEPVSGFTHVTARAESSEHTSAAATASKRAENHTFAHILRVPFYTI